MNAFKRKLTVVVIVLSVTFLILIGYSVKKNKPLAIQNYTGSAFNIVQKYLYKAGIKVKNSIGFIMNFSNVKKENERLTRENNELNDRLINYEATRDENERLRNILNYKQSNSEYDFKVCDNIGKSSNDYLEGFYINKGKKDGIDKNMAVINSYGLVGQVTSAGDNWALVQTIQSENIAVGGYVIGTKSYTGIVRGYVDKYNNLMAKIYYLPINSKIKAGDQVLTGIVNINSDKIQPGIYPKGIKIGMVLSIEEDKVNMMKTALIKPYVDFSRIEEVTVLVPKVSRNINN